MSRHPILQLRVTHRGREFHFVSYEPIVTPANRALAPSPWTWYLMNEGKRLEVMPHAPEQTPEEIEQDLIRWLESYVYAPPVHVTPVVEHRASGAGAGLGPSPVKPVKPAKATKAKAAAKSAAPRTAPRKRTAAGRPPA
jgi:hypothetical protein